MAEAASSSQGMARVRAALPGLHWIEDAAQVARLSQDFYWYSPVLKRQLAGRVAEAVVRPRSVDELRAVVGACAREGVAITPRGAGTGNYGQAVPLHGGVVIDFGGLNRVAWVRPGAARAQAGTRLADLDRAAREHGQELRLLPSTYRIASVGGLFAGGFGGIGSINYGPLGAPGNLLGVCAMSVEPEPRPLELRGAEALHLHHMWGTNGLVVEVELALAPAQAWAEHIVTFAERDAALDFAHALAAAPGLLKKNVCVLLDPVPRYLTRLHEHLPPGAHAIIALVAETSEPALAELVAARGGTTRYRAAAADVGPRLPTLQECCWNHTTLHALKVDPTLTYLQNSFTPGIHLQQVREVHALFGDELMWHLEFIRGMDGALTCTALPLVRYSSEDRLNQIIATLRERGVRVNNPHVNTVEDGKFGGTLAPEAVAMKRRLDPEGRLNPGKLRSWPVVDGA